MQRYLQLNTLKELGIDSFDSWASTFGETKTAMELAPEGTGYRARTRFTRFVGLAELLTIFKEVADIKVKDIKEMDVPNAVMETISIDASDEQKKYVDGLASRAARIRDGGVDPSEDNMLKVTNEGRKLALDQRLVGIEEENFNSKAKYCVNQVMDIYEKYPGKTQVIFLDLSTPKKGEFNVYDDVKAKLIERGIPEGEIAFIHSAKTNKQKVDLCKKVNEGVIRVLLGSTDKAGTGCNFQKKLIALHDLDCPWRPSDLTQRSGRIIRQGNFNKEVYIYRYVTKNTFDSYLWQTVENKQKFISQIMSSKSPVRSCDDVDETALSFAEIKALCAGDPRIKERMDLDVDVSRLKLMKADHQSKQYQMEDNLLKYFPEQIEKHKGFIKGLEADMETLAAHPHPADSFAGMEVRGDTLTDKENAGAALLDACKEVKNAEPVQVGSYRGFAMSVSFDAFRQEYTLQLKGQMTHQATLGADPRGNLTRIDNALAQMPQRLESVKAQLDNLYQQQAAAKEEVGRPFPYEDELREKSARLTELDTLLNIDSKAPGQQETIVAKSTRPSVLEGLRRPMPQRAAEKKSKTHEEVR